MSKRPILNVLSPSVADEDAGILSDLIISLPAPSLKIILSFGKY